MDAPGSQPAVSTSNPGFPIRFEASCAAGPAEAALGAAEQSTAIRSNDVTDGRDAAPPTATPLPRSDV